MGPQLYLSDGPDVSEGRRAYYDDPHISHFLHA